MKFVLSSHNLGKLNEIREVLCPLNIDVYALKDLGFNTKEPDETGKTFKENARIKALFAYSLTHMPTIADDSGLEVEALGGKPGVYSSRFAGESASEQENTEKLLFELKDVPEDQRTARYVCCMCCILPNGKEIFEEASISGSIAFNQMGFNGFGYDNVFIFDSVHTFAQVTSEVKNKISHRAKALNKLYKKLKLCINQGEI